METHVDEIGDRIYRFSTFISDAGLTFNQFLIDADEPLLFHTGMRALFPLVRDAMAKVMAPERLRWIAFGHYEADECGAMNAWLAAAPTATVMHGHMGVMVSIMDQADRMPRPLENGEVLDLGGKRVRYLATPHVPHGWDAGVLFEETTNTLFAGDLFTRFGPGAAISDADPIAPAMEAEDRFGATAMTPATAPTIRGLADVGATTLALMHAPAYRGDVSAALTRLSEEYDTRFRARVAAG
ncbi:MAG: MBL fold metallo-hydrolase [Candidatus Velthaea sp.]